MSNTQPKKKHADGQLTGLAGEFFVAGQLLKRNLQTSITFGSAKAIDIFAHSEETGITYTVQVKSLRHKNFFPIKRPTIDNKHIYVFVILNKPEDGVDYFVVPGDHLSGAEGELGKYLDDPKFPGVNWRSLEPYRDNWQVFK